MLSVSFLSLLHSKSKIVDHSGAILAGMCLETAKAHQGQGQSPSCGFTSKSASLPFLLLLIQLTPPKLTFLALPPSKLGHVTQAGLELEILLPQFLEC